MAIGETFLSAFLQVLFQQMLSTGGSQFLKMVGGVDLPKTIKKWKMQLTKLEALLHDAELQQFHSKPVKLWLNDLQDLVFDIEDLLDHFAIEAQRYELKMAEEQEHYLADHTTNSWEKDIYGNSTFLKMEELNKEIGDLGPDAEFEPDNNTHDAAADRPSRNSSSRRESTSLVGEVFGRGDKKQEIITLLLNDDQSAENYVVIPIVGTGGIGKTTLAQFVYNNEQLKGHFDLKAWVCISDIFDVKRVTKDIINSATQGTFNCSNLDQAQVKLQKVLNGKKFFIILDDIWSEEYDDWYKLQIPFRGAKGSRVIITTRIENIAKKMTKNHNTIIRLQGLSDDNIWHLFQHHANEDIDDSKLKDDIVRKCKGLPLAAKALGGLLKSTKEKSQRREILESSVWGEEYKESGVLPVLRLSYQHMPSSLKRVFTYCSVFPKDYHFKEMELVLLWMAHGFLPETRNERMEDVGHKYFNELVSRSLFEKGPSLFEEEFMMHDLIHDVAQLAAGDVCYVMSSKRDDLERIRHLFITNHVQTLGSLNLVPQLRTYLCSNYALRADNLDIFQRMHYIRALRLVSDRIEVLPDSIGDLKHLRYLSLCFPRIKVLPQSISHLWNLQSLCLDGCYGLQKIPHIGSLEKLRHMYINFCDTSSMIMLQRKHKEIPFKEMPLGIGKLTNLQTLGKFVLAPEGGSRIRELGMLNHLRGRLKILGLEYVTKVVNAQETQLHKKDSLDELYMKWGTCLDEVGDMTKRGVIEKLQPHTNIKGCELDGYIGSTFPSWLGDHSFSNMVDIKLKMCHKCECLPPLGQLPSLKSLLIENMNGIKEVGLEFYGDSSTPFPSLKALQFSFMHSWEKWVHPSVDNKAFPILENLLIVFCESLQGDLPPRLPSLRRLEIRGCWQLQSLELKNSSSTTSHLEELYVGFCQSMVSIGHIPLTLQSFVIECCDALKCVEFDEPTSMSPGVSSKASLELPLLTQFRIKFCPSLRSLQQRLLLPVLKSLELRECKNMERLFSQLVNCSIHQCPEIHSIAEGGLPRNLKAVETRDVNIAMQKLGFHLLHSLEDLVLQNVGSSVDSIECIEGSDLCLPSSSSSLEIHDFHSLETIKLNSVDLVDCILCPHLSLPSSLHKLDIEGFQNLKCISKGNTFPNLTHLSVNDCPKLESLVCNFTSLTDLSIKDCPSLISLVSDFASLPKLFSINIKYCPKLESLGDNGLPPNIMEVHIEECAMIEQHLKSDPNGCIETENGRFSLLLSGSQPSSPFNGFIS